MVGPVTRSPLLLDLALSALAGVALWAAFPDLSWSWTTVPALALYFSRIDHAGLGRGLLNTLVFAACWWFPLIDWVPLATGGTLPWVALAATQILAILLFALIARLLRVWAWTRTALGQCGAYALVWVGVEQLRSHYPWSGFPWGNVAMPQVDSPLGRLAPWGGEVLVSLVVVALAVGLRRVFGLRADEDSAHWYTRPAILVLGAAIVAGAWALPLPASQEAGSLRVGVVQGDVELPGADTFAVEGKVAGNNAAMTRELAANGGGVDLGIWGETGADRDPRESALVSRILDSSVGALGAPILFGFANVQDDLRWNWLGVWRAGEGLDPDALYAKQKPVPFGEFIPFRSVISKLATEAAQVNLDMAAAGNPGILHVGLADGRTIPIAVGICFESAYPSVIGEGVRLGGEVIVTPSNNYHFRSSAESAQQAQLLRFRAMEFSRSAIQASTTGESVVIRPDGSIQASTKPQTAAWLAESVPLRTSITPAARMGEIPADVVMIATVVLAIASLGGAIASRGRGRASN